MSTTKLEQQIRSIVDFDQTVVPGSGVKGVMKNVGATSRDLWKVKPSEIHVMPGLNPRVQDEAYFQGLQELAEDMVANGYYEDKPLTGFLAIVEGKEQIVLGDGHRRLAAVQIAQKMGAPIETVPVVMKDKSQLSMADLTKSLLHSNEGKPFTVYEKAVLAKRFKSYGWEDARIAKEMRVTPAFVGQILTLASAPIDVQNLVKTGVISATHAIETLKAKGEQAEVVIKEAVAKAAKQGKGKVTAKDMDENTRKRRAKNIGYELYSAVVLLFADKQTMQVIDRQVYEELDRLVTEVENGKPRKPREPKASKAPKADKKVVPLAKKVARASKKAGKASKQRTAEEQWAQITKKPEQQEHAAAKVVADRHAVQSRRREFH